MLYSNVHFLYVYAVKQQLNHLNFTPHVPLNQLSLADLDLYNIVEGDSPLFGTQYSGGV